ncbi:hypothetical protein ABH944_002897 [Caballeronia udeis]|uniref:PGDYG protein n=1 Tax=Caballeronia udeis TaxID=1232866 RepID=A0ABW8MH04_9BURK
MLAIPSDTAPEAHMLSRLKDSAALYETLHVVVTVEFSTETSVIQTLEGPVVCNPGDAIITGAAGERWPVSKERFDETYHALEAGAAGAPMRYKKRHRRVHAVRLKEPLEVTLTGGRGLLHGEPGAWCVWYGPEDAAIVRHDIFLTTYQLETVPVYVEISRNLTDTERLSAESSLRDLKSLIKHTELVVLETSADQEMNEPRVWFKVVREAPVQGEKITPTLEIYLAQLLPENGRGSLRALLEQALHSETWWAYTRQAIKRLFGRAREITEQEDDIYIIADQLAAIDQFNKSLVLAHGQTTNSGFLEPCPGDLSPPGSARILEVGIIADRKASQYQTLWQRLVLGTAREIGEAGSRSEVHARSHRKAPFAMRPVNVAAAYGRRILAFVRLLCRPSLTACGLLAALFLVAFTELSSGCAEGDPFSLLGCHAGAWSYLAGPIFFGFYSAVLVLGWIRFATARSGKWQERHFDLRLLAECLRAQYVMAALGEDRCVADYLPLMDHAESSWVRLSLRSIFFAQGVGDQARNARAEEWALEAFVQDQLGYHRTNLIARRKKAFHTLEGWGQFASRIFLLAILVLAADLLVQHASGLSRRLQPGSELQGFLSPMAHHLLVVVQILALAGWGGMRKVNETFGFEQEIHRGLLVQHKLKVAEEQCRVDARAAILHVCRYFIRDQAAWHALHRSKPIDVATGS